MHPQKHRRGGGAGVGLRRRAQRDRGRRPRQPRGRQPLALQRRLEQHARHAEGQGRRRRLDHASPRLPTLLGPPDFAKRSALAAAVGERGVEREDLIADRRDRRLGGIDGGARGGRGFPAVRVRGGRRDSPHGSDGSHRLLRVVLVLLGLLGLLHLHVTLRALGLDSRLHLDGCLLAGHGRGAEPTLELAPEGPLAETSFVE